MPEPTPPLLSVGDLTFSYGSLQVLFGVSLTVGPGETVALLGTNGAGKSTLLRCLSGLETPSGGAIVFDGAPLVGVPAEQRVQRGLALVPGGKALFADLTVEENLRIGATPLGRDAALAAERVAAVHELFPVLAERRRQLAGSLSGGQQQMLALAKALLLQPKLLCIDELSLGLAPVVVEQLLGVVAGLRSQGISILLVEQSITVACSLAERAVYLEKGSVRFTGPSRHLLERDDVAQAVFFGAPA
jgi:ABC-type branched-subunit amino acid transport system ATPase component